MLVAFQPCIPPSTPLLPFLPAASAYREVGLNLAVARMRRGGMARVWVGPQYGYGQQGSFSFPTVPPAATLVCVPAAPAARLPLGSCCCAELCALSCPLCTCLPDAAPPTPHPPTRPPAPPTPLYPCSYELELLDFEAPDDEGDEPPRVGMLFEQRLEAAERRRLAGNALFKEGRLREALSKYRWAYALAGWGGCTAVLREGGSHSTCHTTLWRLPCAAMPPVGLPR